MSSQKIYKNFLFHEKRDKDILDWLNSKGNQSEIVRDALRMAMVREGVIVPEVSLADVMAEVKRLSEQVAKIKIVSADGRIQNEEPQDVVNKLKNFGL